LRVAMTPQQGNYPRRVMREGLAGHFFDRRVDGAAKGDGE
jgi:hypothetical protein